MATRDRHRLSGRAPALEQVGVPWRQSSWKTISVSNREGVATLDRLVGPKC
jgi:hypothetical protein